MLAGVTHNPPSACLQISFCRSQSTGWLGQTHQTLGTGCNQSPAMDSILSMVEKETCVPPQGKSVMKDKLCVVVTCWRKATQPAVVEDVSAHSSGVENKP